MSVPDLLCGIPLVPCSAWIPGTVSAQVSPAIGINTALHESQGATTIETQTRIELASTKFGEAQPSLSMTLDGSTEPEMVPTGGFADGLDSASVPFSSSPSTSSPSTLTSDDYLQSTFTTIVTVLNGTPTTVTIALSATRTTTVQTQGAFVTAGADSSDHLKPSPSNTLPPSDSLQSDKMKIIVPSVTIALVVLTLLILSLFYWRRRVRHSKYAVLTPYTMGPTSRGHRSRMSIYRRTTTLQARSYTLSQHSSNDSLAPLLVPFEDRAWIPRFLFRPRRVRDIEVRLVAVTYKLDALEQAIQPSAQGPSPTSTDQSHATMLASYNPVPDEQAWGAEPPPRYVSGTAPLGAPVIGSASISPGRK